MRAAVALVCALASLAVGLVATPAHRVQLWLAETGLRLSQPKRARHPATLLTAAMPDSRGGRAVSGDRQ